MCDFFVGADCIKFLKVNKVDGFNYEFMEKGLSNGLELMSCLVVRGSQLVL